MTIIDRPCDTIIFNIQKEKNAVLYHSYIIFICACMLLVFAHNSMRPQSYHLVFPTTTHSFTVDTPVDGINFVFMTREVNRKLSSSYIPHFQRGIFGT